MELIKEEITEEDPKKQKVNEIPSSEYLFFQNPFSPGEKNFVSDSSDSVIIQGSDIQLSQKQRNQIITSNSLYLESKQMQLFRKYSKEHVRIKQNNQKSSLKAFKSKKNCLADQNLSQNFPIYRIMSQNSDSNKNEANKFKTDLIPIFKIKSKSKIQKEQHMQNIPYLFNSETKVYKRNNQMTKMNAIETNPTSSKKDKIKSRQSVDQLLPEERESLIKKELQYRQMVAQAIILIILAVAGYIILRLLDLATS